MLRKSAEAAAIAILLALPALAQNPPAAPPVRVRGTIEQVDGAKFTVKARDGMDVNVAVTDATRIQSLVKKSLADIKAGDFLASTGMKGTDGKLHAIEVRIFPQALDECRFPAGRLDGNLSDRAFTSSIPNTSRRYR